MTQQKMKFGGGMFPPPQGNFPQSYPEFGFGSGGGPQGIILPSFEVPFADLGAGVVSTAEIRTNATPTFTRATTAWTRLSTLLWASVASGSPRSYYRADGVYAGYLAEVVTTNRCLWSRDLTNVAWVAVNTTPLKTQAGIDGVTNSCSLLTADLDAGTLLQTVVSASATRTYSAHIKRSVGTGTLEMTVDGVTWTAVTSSVGVGSFGLCQITQAAVTNPIMGFRIGTAGDAFIIDMCQEETQSRATTPMPCTTVAVVRNADILTYPSTGWYNATEGTFFTEATPIEAAVSATTGILGAYADANNRISLVFASAGGLRTFVRESSVTGADFTSSGTLAVNSRSKLAVSYKANDVAASLNNASGGSDASVAIPTITTFEVGSTVVGTGSVFGGCLRSTKYFNRRLSDSQRLALTA